MNGRCMGHGSWCNGRDDCGDNSDEMFCNSKSISKYEAVAASSRDTFTQLPPSPAALSATLCTADQFQCRDGSCISNSSKCDQKVDCEDASDEMNCSKCSDRNLPNRLKKSQYVVAGCGVKECCSLCLAATDCSTYFHLGVKGVTFQKCEFTTLCYAPSWLCDGANDCGDFSDERNCPGNSDPSKRCGCFYSSGIKAFCLTVWVQR